jgi:gliding motility-associated-like protein
MSRQLIFRLIVLILLSGFTSPFMVFATHQRAAEMSFRHVSGLTYELTLISYTFTPSPANAYRDFLTINWGDGNFTDIPRVVETNLPDEITYNKYIGQHTFSGPANYIISCEDPNRNGGIINIPNSINTPMYIYCELLISPFLSGYDNSPVLLVPPVDNGCVLQPFYHNPGAYDPDGDSLSFKLVPCRGAQGQEIPGYTYPDASNKITLDPVTGDFLWDSPKQPGEYNIAILVEEWRNGYRLGSVLRDMQIIVVACDNRPPVIDSLSDTCIEAGKHLRFEVKAYDPDSNNVALSGTGGPFILTDNPATLDPNPATGLGHVQAQFHWNTVCSHVQKQPYQVFFKAKDDAKPVSLATIQSVNILVIGPAPKNLTAFPMGNTVTLNWDNYSCSNATGYQIWRKADSTGYIPGYCQTGVPAYLGYNKISEFSDIAKNSFFDDNNGAGLVRGLKYCYLLVATYPDKSESFASNEACATLKKDVPVITNVSIKTTSGTNGSIYLAWSKPTEIDPVQAPGPYEYVIARSRSDASGQYVLVDSLNSLDDTIMTDTLLNTASFAYQYRIDLYNLTPGNRFLIGSSQAASSVFLTLAPTDQSAILTWTNAVPWSNYRYTIYRKGPASSVFDSVGTSTVNSYDDAGLENGSSYCYKIKSIGKYSASGFVDPIFNLSQETCAIPVDNIPPCPPLLTIVTKCKESANILSWSKPAADSCNNDISKYYIYYTPVKGEPKLIDSVMNPHDTVYMHKPPQTIVGCYGIVAVDSAGNRSRMSDIICIDISEGSECLYHLPNFFSPNNDEWNNYFTPFEYTSVSAVDMKIFDRWGKEVFETKDPDINWDGKDKTTNQPCSDGTYFYICDVYEITLTGTIKRNLRGSVTILR